MEETQTYARLRCGRYKYYLMRLHREVHLEAYPEMISGGRSRRFCSEIILGRRRNEFENLLLFLKEGFDL